MTTWAQHATDFIAELDADIPADATLQERRRILDDNAWGFHRSTSHGQKVWGRAKRAYLEKHGQPHGYGMKKAPCPLFEQGGQA